jgi:SAM-dependent methyltransferase
MHYVHACEQQFLVGSLLRALKPGGAILFFEHNPWNVITRHLVNTCSMEHLIRSFSLGGKYFVLATRV